MMRFRWPLMDDNITGEDIEAVIRFLRDQPILTQSGQVSAFEREWSAWLGVRYSVFVNSGSSANFITMMILRNILGRGSVIVPPIAWVSDIASVFAAGMTPFFVDIDPRTLCMDTRAVLPVLEQDPKAVFLTHVQGFNGVTRELLSELEGRGIPLIEDACEAHGATFQGRKAGSFGWISNFSFYFAHHMTTIEGGMICTDDEQVHQMARMLRSHGMVREASDDELKAGYEKRYPELNPEFIFAYPGYNMRNTEIGAVLGRCQLKRLDGEIEKRNRNFRLFLENLDPERYRTDFDLAGASNYAFNLVLREPDPDLCGKVMAALKENGIEFRRGSSGGGNQLRQPYMRGVVREGEWKEFPQAEHIHFYGFYIGNYPTLKGKDILALCEILNAV
jgi:CDP-6-deoxy-D-xylo-4-hexulose-3-dehydrase